MTDKHIYIIINVIFILIALTLIYLVENTLSKINLQKFEIEEIQHSIKKNILELKQFNNLKTKVDITMVELENLQKTIQQQKNDINILIQATIDKKEQTNKLNNVLMQLKQINEKPIE